MRNKKHAEKDKIIIKLLGRSTSISKRYRVWCVLCMMTKLTFGAFCSYRFPYCRIPSTPLFKRSSTQYGNRTVCAASGGGMVGCSNTVTVVYLSLMLLLMIECQNSGILRILVRRATALRLCCIYCLTSHRYIFFLRARIIRQSRFSSPAKKKDSAHHHASSPPPPPARSLTLFLDRPPPN